MSVTEENSNTKWKVGQKVEACDTLGNWYPAKVIEIQNDQVLIHFQRWSRRYDQWFNMDSELIRELNDVKPSTSQIQFKIGEDVLARWSDNKTYPGRIDKIFPDNSSCFVWFYDGYRKKLKLDSLQKLPDDYQGEKFPSFGSNVILDQPESFVCEVCQKVLRKKLLLEQHLKHVHNIAPEVIIDDTIIKDSTNVTKEESINLEKIETLTKTQNESQIAEDKEKLKREISQLLTRKALAFAAEKSAMQTSLNPEVNSTTALPRSSLKIVDTKLLSLNKRKRSDNRRSRKINFRVQKGKLAPASRPYLMKNGKPNNVLPFNDAMEIVHKNENLLLEEIVKCACGYEYESGLMVQCEHCLYWQHGSCVGYAHENDVPDGYLCPFCRNATCGQGKHRRNISNINHWLKEGIYPKLDNIEQKNDMNSQVEENNEEERVFREKVKRINFLTTVALDIKENISALNLAIRKRTLPEEEIIEKQKILNEQLELINTQLDELESDDEEISFGKLSRTSSCSTLSADLPDFFGNSSEFDFDENFSTPRPISSVNSNQVGVEVVRETVPRIMFTQNCMEEELSTEQNLPPVIGKLMFVSTPISDLKGE